MSKEKLEELKVEAARRWPLDYTTQVYWIKAQMMAINELVELNTTEPNKIEDKSV